MSAAQLAFPSLSQDDLERVSNTIVNLFSSTDPSIAKQLQAELHRIQSMPEAWGLIAGLSSHHDPNVRFFSAHTAQVKISRDWESLPEELRPALLSLLLDTLSTALLNPSPVVIRKIYGSIASLLLRLPFHQFPDPITTVLQITGNSKWGLEWCGICVEELGRAGISDQKRKALQQHLEVDMPAVMSIIMAAFVSEPEAACKCAESWVGYGISGDNLLTLLPELYRLLPLVEASSAITEILAESIFRFGKATKALTEPLIAWTNSHSLDFDTEEVIGITKMLCALIEHSSEWIVGRMGQPEVQAFLGTILRLTLAEEDISELTLATYPLIQESIMDTFAHDADWTIAKEFFGQLVTVIRTKVRYTADSDSRFDAWRRDAGEVIVCAYYILRDQMLGDLAKIAGQQINGPWQDLEATLYCISFSSEAVPLGEEVHLPVIFGQLLNQLIQRPESRLRRTVVGMIAAYEEWFKFHPEYLLPCLNYLVAALSSSLAPQAATTLKSLCDMCRKSLVDHIGAFAELHGKLGSMGAEEQIKVVQAITSVIQALSPENAISPVEGIIGPILDQIDANPTSVQSVGALAACFKGLSPSEDDIFEEEVDVSGARPGLAGIRSRAEMSIARVVKVWSGDGEMADVISTVVKYSTLSETLVSLSPLPLLSLVCSAAERSPSALWLSLASTLTLRINAPPSPLTVKKDKSASEQQQHEQEEQGRWNVVADAAQRLAAVAAGMLGVEGGMREHPDVVEAFFKFSSALASRFPGVLLRLPAVETYMTLGVMCLAAQERFSLTTTASFFVALFANTRFPSPLEPIADTIIKHFGPLILRALLLSAGSDGPRSVIPNLAELLASLVTRVPGQEMASWLRTIFEEPGFPDPRSTSESKQRLQTEILKSRTAKKMRVALHEFALVARGLDNTTYGNATIV